MSHWAITPHRSSLVIYILSKAAIEDIFDCKRVEQKGVSMYCHTISCLMSTKVLPNSLFCMEMPVSCDLVLYL